MGKVRIQMCCKLKIHARFLKLPIKNINISITFYINYMLNCLDILGSIKYVNKIKFTCFILFLRIRLLENLNDLCSLHVSAGNAVLEPGIAPLI